MDPKVADALSVLLSSDSGFRVISVWAPGAPEDGNAEVLAIFLAKDESALMAAAVEYVCDGKSAS